MLLLNLAFLTWLAEATPEARQWQLRATLGHELHRLLSALKPTEPPVVCFEDLAHALLQLACAAYCGRVLAERAGALEPQAHPLDFASGSGVALHAALGVLVWGVWSAVCEAGGAMLDHYAEWRWTTWAVRHDGTGARTS